MLPIKSKQDVLERALTPLWRQWALLGVPGRLDDKANTSPVVDPEALLLVTSELGRFDARLFDEALAWLAHFGKLINIQRLKSLHRQYLLGNARVLAAIASTLLENSRLAKWRAIEALAEARSGREPLFLAADGAGSPVIGEADPHFAKYGFFRPAPKAGAKSPKAGRDAALAKNVSRYAALLLVKLRALLGVNARAEIITVLLAKSSMHPAALALHIGYLPRSVQDALNEMALSGLLASYRPPGSREKHFSLRPADWSFLLSSPESGFPAWLDWPSLYALLQDTLITFYSPKLMDASPQLLALRLRETFDRHRPALARAGHDALFLQTNHATGVDFAKVLAQELSAL